MDVDTAKSRFEKIVERFAAAGVEFIVIGGQAETLHGSARVTFDSDVCYRRTPGNLKKLVPALRALNVSLRGAPPDLPFLLDERTLSLGSNFTFNSDFGSLDLLGYVEPLGGYDELARNAECYVVAGIPIHAIALDDLIRVKQHIKRAKDRDSLMHLLAIKRVREELARGGAAGVEPPAPPT